MTGPDYTREVPAQEQRPASIAVHEAWLPEQHPLHRPRHGGRQRTALIAAVVFFLTPLLAFAAGVRPAKFENRELTEPPSISDGWGLVTGLPGWAADQLPFRDAAVRSSDWISRSVFGEPAPLGSPPPGVLDDSPAGTPGGAAPGTVGAPAGAQPGVGPIPVAPLPDGPPAAGYPTVIEGESGWLYFGYDVEGKCAPERPLGEVISGLRRLRAAVEASGRRFVLVVAPDKSTAVPGNLPESYPGQGCARAQSERFWSRISTDAEAIDLRPPLRALARSGVPIYNKLDTHWTDAGSLTMVRAVADAIEPGVTRSWRTEPGRIRTSEADLPRLLGRTGTNRVRMYSLAPDGKRDRTPGYADRMLEPVRFESATGRGVVRTPVAMLTDSFSLPASRYLAAAFGDLTAVFYATAESDLQQVTEVVAGSEVVVLEVVERNLASGMPSLLDDDSIDRIAEELKARPVR